MNFEILDVNQTVNSNAEQFNIDSPQIVELICENAGTKSIPSWSINNVTYYWQDVPPGHTFNVKNMTLEISRLCAKHSEYQCFFSYTLQSRSVILLQNGKSIACNCMSLIISV